MDRGKRAIIVGGGVIGVTSAWALARSGWQVEVLDGNEKPGSGASWGCARQLSYTYTDALAAPSILPIMPRVALGMDRAFRLSMPRDPAGFDWFIRFLRNCTSSRFHASTAESLRLAQLSQSELHGLMENHAIAFDHRTVGKLVLYRDRKRFQDAREVMRFKVANGATQHAIFGGQIAEIEPALADFAGLEGAIHAPQDQTGDCAQFTRALMQLAGVHHGVTFRGETQVRSLDRQGSGALVRCADGEELLADMVVVCGGHTSNALLAPHGHRLPLMAMKGYSFTARCGARPPVASVTDGSRRIVFTNLGDCMLVAGFADLGDASPHCDGKRMAQLIEAAREALPDAADYSQVENQWCGHRPVTPSSLPVTRMLEPWLAVNSGHGMLGWTLAMGSARRLEQAVNAA